MTRAGRRRSVEGDPLPLTKSRLRGSRTALAAAILVVSTLSVRALGRQESSRERLAAYAAVFKLPSLVQGGTITPNWLPDSKSFWFAEGAPAHVRWSSCRSPAPVRPWPAPVNDLYDDAASAIEGDLGLPQDHPRPSALP